MAFNARFYINRLIKPFDENVGVGGFARQGSPCFDYCPDTYETPTLTGGICQIDIDSDHSLTGTTVATGYTWAACWLRNYPSGGFGASATFTAYSDNNSSFSSVTSRGTSTFATAGVSATQHLILVTFASQTERWWRFQFTNMVVAPEVSMLMLGHYYDVTRTWDIGGPPHGHTVRHNVQHFNRVDGMSDGRNVAMNMRSRGAAQWNMGWSLLDKTNYEAIVNAHDLARGRFIPFVLVLDDETAMSSHFLCRFTSDMPAITEPAHQLYNILVPMQEVPSTDSGEVW